MTYILTKHTQGSFLSHQTRDGKEPKPSKNKQNQNSGFAKNRTEPNPKVKNMQEPEPNRSRKEPTKPKCHNYGSYSALSLKL